MSDKVLNQLNTIVFVIPCDTTRNFKSSLVTSTSNIPERGIDHAQTVDALFDYIRGLGNTHASIWSSHFSQQKNILFAGFEV